MYASPALWGITRERLQRLVNKLRGVFLRQDISPLSALVEDADKRLFSMVKSRVKHVLSPKENQIPSQTPYIRIQVHSQPFERRFILYKGPNLRVTFSQLYIFFPDVSIRQIYYSMIIFVKPSSVCASISLPIKRK